MNKIIISSALLLFTTGCASITQGTSQSIAIDTNPSCAKCTLTREGALIGSVSCTPGSVEVKKRKEDITLRCSKDGYMETTEILESGTEGYVAGNIIAGGVIGWGIDSATGADNKYPKRKIINLVPERQPPLITQSTPTEDFISLQEAPASENVVRPSSDTISSNALETN